MDQFMEKGRQLVKDAALERQKSIGTDDQPFEVLVVWFNYTLGNAKGIYITTLPDMRLYEVTFNTSKQETYVDEYVKVKNTLITNKEQ